MNYIASIFASPTILEVLDAMYMDISRKYFVRELADICGRYPSGVLNSLRTLERAGVVKVDRRARETYYHLNPGFDGYKELGNLIEVIRRRNPGLNETWQLTVKKGPDLGTSFPLTESVHLIGRHESCHVQLSDPKVSRRHARIRITSEDGQLHMDDLGSKAATYVNSKKKNSSRLTNGDLLLLGNTELVLTNIKARQ